MSAEMQDAIVYLQARLAECRGRPELHRYSMKVYERYLDVAENRPADYVRETGDMFAVMQAEQADREANMADLHAKLGYAGQAAAHRRILEAIESADGFGDIHLKISAARKATIEDLQFEKRRRDLLMELFSLIAAFNCDAEQNRDGRAAQTRKAWAELKAFDPEITWKKIKSDPVYRRYLWHDDERLSAAGHRLNEIIQRAQSKS